MQKNAVKINQSSLDQKELRKILLDLSAKDFFSHYAKRPSYEDIPLMTADGIVIPVMGLRKALASKEHLNIVPTIAGSNIFGATGDLAKRKIIPALFRRFIAGQIPPVSRIIGVSRQQLSNEQFSTLISGFINEFVPPDVYEKKDLIAFCKMVFFTSTDLKSDKGWLDLSKFFEINSHDIRTFYLSISPSLIESCSQKLKNFDLITKKTRVVVEKPLGTNLKKTIFKLN